MYNMNIFIFALLFSLHRAVGNISNRAYSNEIISCEEQPPNPTLRNAASVQKDVSFTLYTRENMNGEIVKPINGSLKNTTFDFSKSTKFIVHGFLSSGNSDTCQDIKNNYLKFFDVNVFVVDWSKIAGNLIYFIPAISTREVGEYYGTFIDFLVDSGADAKKMHLVGHSLGAHISGFAGQFTKHKVARITGLDPAFPSFGMIQLAQGRLSLQQADFVDVIHTSGGAYGLYDPIGHVDFYPNGGIMPQPGCDTLSDMTSSCSHGRSWQFFMESIDPSLHFVAYKSNSYDDFIKKRCENEISYMGEYADINAKGNYYLKTNIEYPYAQGEDLQACT